ncbi:zinc finger BED domain-containing protein RICESLEEPER 1-like [Macadamia integrifolia]|uniref:zinc finger BED domain-containing protein RICESLEEPER 1-like n=1 Tax=Macadamia integrifolia TaxID=60698 RepID=UPI001C4F2C42|nr:zinc finger BED domain-containing protein RICESLEEPER 1-like [Macadamia integrifolia]
MGLTTKRGLHGDVSTRWNSTFQMLDEVLLYRKAFDNFGNLESNYRDCPTKEEWAKIEKITIFFKPFYDITKELSGSKYSTSNLYFQNVVHNHMILNDGSLFGGDFMLNMVCAMREKFNKYWENYSLILSVAAIFDPRFKLEIIEWAYEEIYGDDKKLIDEAIDCVRSALRQLYNEYKSMPKEQRSSLTCDDEGVEDPFTKWMKRKNPSTNDKSELD